MSGAEVLNFGCRLNLAESEAIRAMTRGEDDLIVVNSCAVTAEAVVQARQAIRRAARRRPDARIVVTGCAATLDPARFAAMPEVARVVANDGKREPLPYESPSLRSSPQRTLGSPGGSPSARHGEAPAFAGATITADRTDDGLASRTHARAFVPVQTGCDHRCTFCIIPHARGPSRSEPAGVVVDRIKALVDAGCNEVVLTGVDTTSYGADLPAAQTLGHLVERVLALVPGLGRLRLSSLDSVEIDDRLFALIAGEPRLQPHLHLSLQAGDDMVLKRMKRRHTRAQSIDMVARLKAARPEIAIGADLIAGFPTETDAQAGTTLALIEACDIVHAHIFPYSPRPGTPAARMPQTPPPIVRARADALRSAASARRARWLETLVGTEQAVLIERVDGRGHAGNFASVRLAGGANGSGNRPRRGDVVAVRITGAGDDMLTGELA